MNMDMFGKSDPYATLQISNGEKMQTQTINDRDNPEWKFIADFPIDMAEGQQLKVEVFDEDDIGMIFFRLCETAGILVKPSFHCLSAVLSLKRAKVFYGCQLSCQTVIRQMSNYHNYIRFVICCTTYVT